MVNTEFVLGVKLCMRYSNAAFGSGRKYRKYEFPSWKFRSVHFPTCIYYRMLLSKFNPNFGYIAEIVLQYFLLQVPTVADRQSLAYYVAYVLMVGHGSVS